MKVALLRRTILIELAFFTMIALVLAASIFGLISLYGSYQEKADIITSTIATLDSESRQLQEKFDKAQKSMPVYEEIIRKNKQAGFSLNREVAQQKFDTFKNRYHLSSLRINMSPVQEAKDDKFKRKTAYIISNEVGLKYEAVSDEDVFSIFQDLPNEMSGAIRMTKFTALRLQPVNNPNLMTLSQGGTMGMVAGEFRFVWLGMKSYVQDAQKAAAAASAAAAAAPPAVATAPAAPAVTTVAPVTPVAPAPPGDVNGQ